MKKISLFAGVIYIHRYFTVKRGIFAIPFYQARFVRWLMIFS